MLRDKRGPGRADDAAPDGQTRAMHVYVDDSGDGGMKLNRGSSSLLVFAAVTFSDTAEIEHLARQVEACRRATGHAREFKFSHSRDSVKLAFLENLTTVDFAIRAIVVDKSQLTSPELCGNPGKLKSYALRMLLTKNFSQIRQAKVFVDGQDTRGFGISDEAYLRGVVNREAPGTIRQVRFVDSRTNVGVQLADMVAGAAHRAHRPDAKSDSRCWDIVRSKSWQPRGTCWRFPGKSDPPT